MGGTEIYICTAGQSLKDGKIEYSGSVTNRAEAIADAEARCRANARIAKIAYYKVNDEGDFRCFYTHQGEGAAPPGSAGKKDPPPKRKVQRKKKPKKKSFWQKLFGG